MLASERQRINDLYVAARGTCQAAEDAAGDVEFLDLMLYSEDDINMLRVQALTLVLRCKQRVAFRRTMCLVAYFFGTSGGDADYDVFVRQAMRAVFRPDYANRLVFLRSLASYVRLLIVLKRRLTVANAHGDTSASAKLSTLIAFLNRPTRAG